MSRPPAHRARTIVIVDCMSAHFASPTEFVQSLVDDLNIAWSRAGVAGASVHFAEWDCGVVTIETRPGAMALTVEAVRAAIKANGSYRTGAAAA